MASEQQVLDPEQWTSGAQGLLLGDVERGASQAASSQRLEQSRFINELPSRRVDEIGRGLHSGKGGAVKQVRCLTSKWGVEAYEIGLFEELLEGDQPGAVVGGQLGGGVRIRHQQLP